jgi:hypothetical protein
MSGTVQAGTGGSLTTSLTPTITGTSYVADYPSATIAGNPAGISVSFNPVAWESAPPEGAFTVTVTVSSTVPVGSYAITMDVLLLPGGDDCSGSCVQPVYTLDVDAPGTPGIPVQANLQDAVTVSDENVLPASASLSDGVLVGDSYEQPVIAALSDVVNVSNAYVAPVVAALSDAVNVVDSYLSPVTAPLHDAVSLVDQVTKASPQATTVLGIGLVSVGLVALVLLRKRPDQET